MSNVEEFDFCFKLGAVRYMSSVGLLSSRQDPPMQWLLFLLVITMSAAVQVSAWAVP